MLTRYCKNPDCKKKFNVGNGKGKPNQRYCSAKCKKESQKFYRKMGKISNQTEIMKRCKWCGVVYIPEIGLIKDGYLTKDDDKKKLFLVRYCSKECSVKSKDYLDKAAHKKHHYKRSRVHYMKQYRKRMRLEKEAQAQKLIRMLARRTQAKLQ